MMCRFLERLTYAPEVLPRRRWQGFGVSMPIAQEEERFTMGIINLSLFRPSVRLVRISRANVDGSRSRGEFDGYLVTRQTAEQLSSGFGVPRPELLMSLEDLQHFRLHHELLSGLADVEIEEARWRCPQAVQSGSSCQMMVS